MTFNWLCLDTINLEFLLVPHYLCYDILDSSHLVGLGIFDMTAGTVIISAGLWQKMGYLSIIFCVSCFICNYLMVPEKINTDALADFLGGIDALMAFFAGMYVAQILDR